MAVNKDELALLDFYLFSDLNDETYIDEYLKLKDLDIDLIALNLFEFLGHKRSELKLEEGRKFRELYLNAINEEKLNQAENEVFSTAESDIILAYRKASGNLEEDDKDIVDDIRKINILKKLTRKINPPNDKQD